MSLTVGFNSTTYQILSAMTRVDNELDNSMTRMATGKRINSAKDDPSGLIALSQMNSDLVSVNAALENNQRSQAVLDSADASLEQVSYLASQIEERIADANDPSATAAEIASYQSQIDEAVDSIDRLVTNAEYGGKKLFSGNSAIAAADSGNGNITDISVYSGDHTIMNGAVDEVWVVDATDMTAITVDGNTASGEMIKKEDGTDSNYARIHYVNGDWNVSFVIDQSTAAADDELTVTVGTGMNFQVGTDNSSKSTRDLGPGMTTAELGRGVVTTAGTALAGALSSIKSGGANDLDTAGNQAAEIAAEASKQIAIARAQAGAFNKYQIDTAINILESTQSGLLEQIGSIEDADYAAESAAMDRNTIMQSAMVTLLARANSMNANVLALLQ